MDGHHGQSRKFEPEVGMENLGCVAEVGVGDITTINAAAHCTTMARGEEMINKMLRHQRASPGVHYTSGDRETDTGGGGQKNNNLDF